MPSHTRQTNRCQMPIQNLLVILPAASLSLSVARARQRASIHLIYLVVWSIGAIFPALSHCSPCCEGRGPRRGSGRWRSLGQALACAGRRVRGLGQPALAPAVVLEVAVGFTRADLVEAEIELLDVGVLPQ